MILAPAHHPSSVKEPSKGLSHDSVVRTHSALCSFPSNIQHTGLAVFLLIFFFFSSMAARELRTELSGTFMFGMRKNVLKKKQRVDRERPGTHHIWDQRTKEFKEGRGCSSLKYHKEFGE